MSVRSCKFLLLLLLILIAVLLIQTYMHLFFWH